MGASRAGVVYDDDVFYLLLKISPTLYIQRVPPGRDLTTFNV
jgi:hypothetical protein